MEAILFDWDGTLADSLDAFYRANARVAEHFGVPFDRDRYRAVYTPDWRRFYGRLGIPEARLDEANELWWAAFEPAARPLAGAREALEALAAAGFRLGLVTATPRAIVDPQVAGFGMVDLLVVRVCGDDLAAVKPDPAPLRRALDELGLADRPEAATYVGDAPDDMRMARATGTGAVGVRSLLGADADLLAAGAGSVHDSVAEWARSFLAASGTAAVATG
jgi:phosphoglycolate phosphatase